MKEVEPSEDEEASSECIVSEQEHLRGDEKVRCHLRGDEKVRCPVCWSSPPDSPVWSLRNCGHAICTVCVLRHIQTTIENLHSVRVPCPAQLHCRESLHPNDISYFLKAPDLAGYFVAQRWSRLELFSRWEFLQLASALSEEKSARWCPWGCKFLVLCGPNAPLCPLVRCGRCQKYFCTTCATPAHPGEPCRDTLDIAEQYPNLKLDRKCPQCHTAYQKYAGCNYVRCVRQSCKARFCWNCGERVSSAGHFGRRNGCRLSYRDYFEAFWPIRCFVDTPFFLLLLLAPFLLVVALITVPPIILVGMPTWWTLYCWRKLDQRRHALWLRCALCTTVFVAMFWVGLGVALGSVLWVLCAFVVFLVLSCPCVPVVGAVRTALSCVAGAAECLIGDVPHFVRALRATEEYQENQQPECLEYTV